VTNREVGTVKKREPAGSWEKLFNGCSIAHGERGSGARGLKGTRGNQSVKMAWGLNVFRTGPRL